jgi:DNA-binding response OmpR family regulator
MARALVIEDEFLVALHIADIAEDAGCHVDMVANEQQAVAVARDESPDVVLADVDLGRGGDGLAAVRRIHRVAEVPVILVTANADLADHTVRQLVDVIGKPFDGGRLKASIRKAIGSPSPADIVS